MKALSNQKPKLLVVDDEPDNLDLLYRTFYREFRVLKAENGPTALDILAKEGDIAVIISDQRMPHMSGTEFLSLTATQYPDIIRIILTGYTDVVDLVEAINSGKVFKYVTKPWDEEELKAVVRQAVDTHNVLQARTRELRRSLRQESLLNAVTNSIRSALSYRQILEILTETIGTIFETDVCLVVPYENEQLNRNDCFFYLGDAGIAQLPQELVVLQQRLSQTVWETHTAQILSDVLTDARLQGDDPEIQQRRQVFEAAKIRASLLVPLMCQQELMGVLALHQWREARTWQDDEVQLLLMVADQAALALSQARAYEQVRTAAKRESLINTITAAIRSSLEPQEIFAAITQQLGQALHVDGCALSLWTENDDFVHCVGLHEALTPEEHEAGLGAIAVAAESESDADLAYRPLPKSVVPITGNPVLRQLIMTQQPVVLHDLDQHPEMATADQPFRARSRALLVVPLITDGKIIGSISLRQNQHPRHWQASEVELAQTVASQAAIAVQQARLYQKTRQQAEKLIELDRQKNEFFQNISHEFRTPLTLMIGPLEVAIANKQELPIDQAEVVLRNSRRLLRLVNQLLDLQRLDARRMQPAFRPCNLVEFVNQTVSAFRPYCEKKGITLTTHLQVLESVYLDLEKFDKVLYNLLSNAMKFTSSGGQITVTLEPAGDHCLLKVSDTGIGIRPDQIPYLFERFRQAEGSANRSYEGSGLGLSLVKELVELHGGQISVESTYGAGTTFTLWLPIGSAHLPPQQVINVQADLQPSRAAVELADIETDALDAQQDTIEPIAPASEHGSEQILVVDDNPDLRTYVSGILQQRGYRVVTARNGDEGFRAVQVVHPDLIITDLMMPQVSGLDLIGLIREAPELQSTPIVLLTAKADEDTRIDGVERGADAYLAKPFSDRELLAEVNNLLALKRNERRIAELNTYLTESVLKRFLPPSMVQRAAKGELILDLRPEPRMVTVLFSDIVGFTQLSNTLRSRRVAEILNEYLTTMTHVVFEQGGTIDKFMGDAILVMFGAPEELTPNEQVSRAVATARQMRAKLQELNRRWREQGIESEVLFRCGIHQGTAVVGMFGGSERSDYTAIGPCVNIAARIQEAAEPGVTLVSAAVADYLEDDEITKCSPLRLKGVDETVLTFALAQEPSSHHRPNPAIV